MKTQKRKRSKLTNAKKNSNSTDSKINSKEESHSNKTMVNVDLDLKSDNCQLKKDASIVTEIPKKDLRNSPKKNHKNEKSYYSTEEAHNISPSKSRNDEEKNSNKTEVNNSKKKNDKTTPKSNNKNESITSTEENSKVEEENISKLTTERSQRQGLKRKVQSINKALNLLNKDEVKDDGDSVFDTPKKTFGNKKKKEQDSKIENDNNESDVESSTEYEVEKLVDVYFKKNGKREFLVRWKGYSPKYDTWEPEKNLNCQELIENFIKKCEKARDLPVREMRTSRRKTDRYTVNEVFKGRKLSSRLKHLPRKTYYDDL